MAGKKKEVVQRATGKASLLHWFSSSPAPNSSASSSAAPSSPVRNTTSSSQLASQTRMLGATQSAPVLGPSGGVAQSSLLPPTRSTSAGSLDPAAASPRRSLRVQSTMPATPQAGPSRPARLQVNNVKQESKSPRDVKPILRSSSVTANGNGKGKGKAQLIELSDSDEENPRADVLAPSSLSPSTKEQKRTALDWRMRAGKDGHQELDLTLSSPAPSPRTGPAPAADEEDEEDDDDEIIVASTSSSTTNSPTRASSRASSKTPRPPSRPASRAGSVGASARRVGKGKAAVPAAEEEEEEQREPSPRTRLVRQASLHAPAASSPLKKGAPMTPRKALPLGGPTPSSTSAAHVTRSTTSARSLSNVPEASPSAEAPSTLRTRSRTRITTPLPAQSDALPTSPSHGLTKTSNLELIGSPPRPESTAAAAPASASTSSLSSLAPTPTSASTPAPPLTNALSALASPSFFAAASATTPRTPQRTASLAAFVAANRTPGGGPTFAREVSGSPLSSAGPTPRPLSRNTTWPLVGGSEAGPSSSSRRGGSVLPSSRAKKQQSWDLVIDARPSQKKVVGNKTFIVRSRPKKPAGSGSLAGKMRRAREGRTSEYGSEDVAMQEASESGEDEEDAESDEEEYHSARASPSPDKRRAGPFVDNGKGKLRELSPETDEEDEATNPAAAARGENGSDAASPRSKRSSSPSSSAADNSDSDGDDFAAMMAAATARRAAGTSLLPAAGAGGKTSPGTAATTVSPPATAKEDSFAAAAAAAAAAVEEESGIRRSSRAKHAPEHYSPSKPVGSSSRAGGRASFGGAAAKEKEEKKTDLLGLGKGPRGGLSFEKLLKERKDREAKGRGTEWFDKMVAGLGESSDEELLDRDSDASAGSDLDEPTALTKFKPLDAKTVQRALASSDAEDDDLPAPSKPAAGKKRKADALEQVIAEEAEREKKKRQGGESKRQREERTVWRKEEVRVEPLETVAGAWTGEGWRGKVAQVLKEAVVKPSAFPSPALLFSPVAGTGNYDDHVAVSRWVLALVSHPSTSRQIAERAVFFLARISQHTARAAPSSTLLNADDLVGSLSCLGAKPAAGPSAVEKSDVVSPTSDDSFDAEHLLGISSQKVLVDSEARKVCVQRWCQVVQHLTKTTPPLLYGDDAVTVVGWLVRLSLDPKSASLRHSLLSTISTLLNSLPSSSTTREDIFRLLARLHHKSRPGLQYEVLLTLPHDSLANKNLRKWLAATFLSTNENLDKMLEQPTLSTSVFPAVQSFLASPPPTSAFRLAGTAAVRGDTSVDIKLHEQAQILMIAVTNLADEIVVDEDRVETRKVLDGIVDGLQAIESRLPTDAGKGLQVERLRAKNLLTNLRHSIGYQLKRARGQAGGGAHGFSFAEEEERAKEEEKRARKRVKVEEEREKAVREKGRDGMRQGRLSFGAPAAVATPAASSATISAASTSSSSTLPAPSRAPRSTSRLAEEITGVSVETVVAQMQSGSTAKDSVRMDVDDDEDDLPAPSF
ncbi:hypothetical protein JCM8097_005406 [Rhodosporidiobolus ruineniae]